MWFTIFIFYYKNKETKMWQDYFDKILLFKIAYLIENVKSQHKSQNIGPKETINIQ